MKPPVFGPWRVLFCLAAFAASSALGQPPANFQESALSNAQRRLLREHVVGGLPSQRNVVVRDGYVLSYDPIRRLPLWTAYHVRPEYLLAPDRYRTVPPQQDPDFRFPVLGWNRLPAEYVMQRLAPIEFMGGRGDNSAAIDQASYAANWLMMRRKFAANSLWLQLRSWVRTEWVEKRRGEIWVFAGCVPGENLPAGSPPPLLFQILVSPGARPQDWQALAFLIPHQDAVRGKLMDHLVPIDTLEALTGLDFLSQLPDAQETIIERLEGEETWSGPLPLSQQAKASSLPPGLLTPLRQPASPDVRERSLPARPTDPGPKEEEPLVKVLYGTDRKPEPSHSFNDYYGGQRGPLHYGVASVSIPPTHQRGLVERPQWWKLELLEDPEKHVMIRNLQLLQTDEQFANVLANVGQGQEAFVFVHGYNNSFDVALRRTAQMAFDLDMKYLPIMYSWPSQAHTTQYPTDELEVALSEDNFRHFLAMVARHSGAKTIHLIAHSMGSRLMANTLAKIAQEPNPPRFNQIILAAPDIKAKHFEEIIAPRIQGFGDRLTIYVSNRDRALMASKYVNQLQNQLETGAPDDERRLGAGGSDLSRFLGLEQVDASEVDTSVMGHAYYGSEAPVIKDIAKVLTGETPEARRLEKLPKNYLIPSGAREAAAELPWKWILGLGGGLLVAGFLLGRVRNERKRR